VFQGVNHDIQVWPDAQGRTSWLGRFIAYLKAHNRLNDLAFVSFEHLSHDNRSQAFYLDGAGRRIWTRFRQRSSSRPPPVAEVQPNPVPAHDASYLTIWTTGRPFPTLKMPDQTQRVVFVQPERDIRRDRYPGSLLRPRGREGLANPEDRFSHTNEGPLITPRRHSPQRRSNVGNLGMVWVHLGTTERSVVRRSARKLRRISNEFTATNQKVASSNLSGRTILQ